MRELVPVQIANITRIENETGWRPSIKLKGSLKDMIEELHV